MEINEKEFDAILTKALYRAAELDYGEIPSDDELNLMVTPSVRFMRKRRALLRNPRRYIRNRQRPIYAGTLRSVAVVVISLALLLGTVMAVSPTARAAVTNFVRSWFEDRTVYTPVGNNLTNEWIFGYIPDGFALKHEMIAENQIFRVYGNNEEYLFVTISASAITLNNEHHYHYEAEINGHIANIYQATTGEHPNNVVIFYAEQSTFILLSSTIAVDELILIAENIR